MTTSGRQREDMLEPPECYYPLPLDGYWEACKLANALPETGHGYLYVIALSTAIIKVGQTEYPRRRIRAHIHAAAPYGVDVVDVWLSDETVCATRLERQLLTSLRGRYFCPAGDEYFRGPTFDEAVAIACRIVANQPT